MPANDTTRDGLNEIAPPKHFVVLHRPATLGHYTGARQRTHPHRCDRRADRQRHGFYARLYAKPDLHPARASFLTGRYPASHHVYRNGNAWFPPHEKLVTKRFAEAGYDCALVGKLHLAAAKNYEVRTDDGYRVFQWSHHPTPDQAYGHDYENWLRHEEESGPG